MFRLAMAVVTPVSVTIISCSPVNPPPPPGGGSGPQFVINSPLDGAQVSGPVFFSVQPLDPDEVRSVEFEAGGTTLEVDAPGETMFKVFVVPDEFADGQLELTAAVTGTNGRSREQSIMVVNVSNPPSSTTVGADGAVLGTQEENGSVSTLVIPPGVGEGANVSFEARSEAEVLAATGVDYEALGVTFLGAQEIGSDLPLDGPLGVSSGGFGPMVQPGQAVVNYMIVPDADSDGVDELVVVNTASVAPNGDVISDPVPQVQLGDAVTVTSTRGSEFTTLQSGISGPPGTILEFEVVGFNRGSSLGNVAVFRSLVDGSEAILLGRVSAKNNGSNGSLSQQFLTAIPLLPEGPASMTLRSQSTGFETAAVTVTITSPVTSGDPAAVVVDGFFERTIAFAEGLSTPSPEGAEAIAEQVRLMKVMRGAIQDLAGEPEVEEGLETLAIMILGSGLFEPLNLESLDRIRLASVHPAQETCLTEDQKRQLKKEIAYQALLAGILCGLGSFVSGPVATALALACGAAVTAIAIEQVDRIDRIPTCEEPQPVPDPPPPGSGCQPPGAMPTNSGSGLRSSISIRPQQVPPPPFTGMGAAAPPGGPGCGNAPAPTASGNSLGLHAAGILDPTPGRVVVKVFFQGQQGSFSGATDTSGYFFIPFIPEGAAFEAIAFDTASGATRTFEGVGPKRGESVFMFFDFLTDTATPGPTTVRWDGDGDGTSWSDPLNWDADTLPGPTDQVIIDVPEDITVTFDVPGETVVSSLLSSEALELVNGELEIVLDSKVANLVIRGGALDGTGDLTVTDTLTFVTGSLVGSGEVFILVGATMEVTRPFSPFPILAPTFHRNLTNDGTVIFEGHSLFGNPH